MKTQTVIILYVIAFLYVAIGVVFAVKEMKEFKADRMEFSVGDFLTCMLLWIFILPFTINL